MGLEHIGYEGICDSCGTCEPGHNIWSTTKRGTIQELRDQGWTASLKTGEYVLTCPACQD